MRIAADQLRHHHFSFVREIIELPDQPLKKPWERYLAFEGGPSDERHYAARLRELVKLMRFAATERGLAARADVALAGVIPPSPPPSPALPKPSAAAPVRTIPDLDEWVGQRCEALGIDVDFQTQAEWLAEYEEEFGLNAPPVPMPATALPSPSPAPASSGRAPSPALPKRQDRLAALNELAHALAKPPALSDPLSAWLSEDLARRLAGTEVDGRRLPLLTLDNLITFVNLYHYRWWEHVPRLGQERGDRLTAWLAPLSDALGRPLKEVARRPQHEIRLARERALRGSKRYGMVPLDQLAVPPDLSGRDGTFRLPGVNVWGVDTDLDAIFNWMARYATSPRTSASYGSIVERFYLWAVLVKRKPMSSLTEGDMRDYRDFITRPPADWVQERFVMRGGPDWRPFRGPLSPASRKRNFIVISMMLSAMVEKAGYLKGNAAEGVLRSLTVRGPAINIDRTFTDAQWAYVMRRWDEEYASCGPRHADDEEQPFCPDDGHPDQEFTRAALLRRTRLVLELGATTGLRLSEFPTTRLKSIARQVVDGEEVWLMTVLGKGNKLREVLLFDDVREMVEQHHRDMDMMGTAFDPSNTRKLRTLHEDDALSSEPVAPPAAEPDPSALLLPGAPRAADDPDWTLRPLIGALRKAGRRWKLDANGVKVIDEESPRNADRYGSIDPSGLYKSLKRFFELCKKDAAEHGLPTEDAKAFASASTHWMRHFFANTALADGVAAEAVKDAMGHKSLNTTSIYLRTERRRMVEQLGKLKRRGAPGGAG
ncbi:site-specific integrase [Methylibium petroleiphilum]|nr:site-specific integrase [Methylibium petroleiphilum]